MKTFKILFLLMGISISSMGFGDALFRGTESNNLAQVQRCIAQGYDINKRFLRGNGETPLYVASQEGHVEVVKELVKANADVNKADKRGITPLSIASQEGHVDVVRLLLDAGADVNKVDKSGITPLSIASSEACHLDLVAIFIRCPIQVAQAKAVVRMLTRWHRQVAQARQKTIDLRVRAIISAKRRCNILEAFNSDFILRGTINRSVQQYLIAAIYIKPKTTDFLPEDRAATKIQAFGRGVSTRKNLEKRKKCKKIITKGAVIILPIFCTWFLYYLNSTSS